MKHDPDLANGTGDPYPAGADAIQQTCDPFGRAIVVGAQRIASEPHVVSAALPAAGALTSQDAWEIPTGITSITVVVTYTLDPAGTGNGFCRARPMWGSDTGETPTPILDATVASTSPDWLYKRQRLYAQEIDLPVPPGADPVLHRIVVDVLPGATTFRLLLAEAGDTANPGTASATIEGGF